MVDLDPCAKQREQVLSSLWAAGWSDHSGPSVIFGSELEARRYAMEHGMNCVRVTLGEPVEFR